MKSLVTLILIASLVLVAGMANAAQPAGQISDNALAQVGLAGMNQLTDVQGSSIRGNGFAAVGGFSWANSPASGTANGYVAVSNPWHGSALAAGGTVSAAASGVGVFTPWGNGGIIIGSAAVGGAVAYAK